MINMKETKAILADAKAAEALMRGLSDERINEALRSMAASLIENTDKILEENEKDVDSARETISAVMIDRLTLTAERIRAMASGITEIVSLPSPLSRVLREVERPNGLKIERVSVPMGAPVMVSNCVGNTHSSITFSSNFLPSSVAIEK